jgi:hypothetical protein
MKKWYLILAIFLLAIILGVGMPLFRSHKINSFRDEMSIHRAVHEVYGNTKGETREGAVLLSPANVYYFEKAITHSGLNYRFFKPDVNGRESVKVTCDDGAVIEIFDAGMTKKGKDSVVIAYSCDGRMNNFSIEAIRRTKECSDAQARRASAERIHRSGKCPGDVQVSDATVSYPRRALRNVIFYKGEKL